MPTCTLQVEANGETLLSSGRPAWLLVFGRIVSGQCSQVRCVVRTAQGGAILFSDNAIVDQNNFFSCRFPLITVQFACGATVWVEATCLSGGDCSVAQSVTIHCKEAPSDGSGSPNPGGNNGNDNNGNNNNGNGDWPFEWPPGIFCPLVGRFFTSTLLLAWTAWLAAVAMQNLPLQGVALGAIVADFIVLGVWMRFCQPHGCYVIGAILWAAKRATIAGIAMLVVVQHLPLIIAIWFTGCVSGVLAGLLHKRRCAIPRVTTSLNHLPIW